MNLCPECGNDTGYDGLFPEHPDEYLTEISPMWVARYKCKTCSNLCHKDELVDYNEYVNIKRTKLIDRMI